MLSGQRIPLRLRSGQQGREAGGQGPERGFQRGFLLHGCRDKAAVRVLQELLAGSLRGGGDRDATLSHEPPTLQDVFRAECFGGFCR